MLILQYIESVNFSFWASMLIQILIFGKYQYHHWKHIPNRHEFIYFCKLKICKLFIYFKQSNVHSSNIWTMTGEGLVYYGTNSPLLFVLLCPKCFRVITLFDSWWCLHRHAFLLGPMKGHPNLSMAILCSAYLNRTCNPWL